MALSAKADNILYYAYCDTLQEVTKLGLTWDLMGELWQHESDIKGIIEPMLAPHIAAGVKLSYSKDNSLSSPVLNVYFKIADALASRARCAAEAKREAEAAAKAKELEATFVPGKRLIGYMPKSKVAAAGVELADSGWTFQSIAAVKSENYCVPVYVEI